MLLKDQVAVVYGGGGAVGGAVAKAFAREGAAVFLAGRTLAKLDSVAREISSAGGVAETAQLDAMDALAVGHHADAVAAKTGRIDIAFNAVGVLHVQGMPFLELPLKDFELPLAAYTRTHFITSQAVAKHMVKRGSGVIFTVSTQASLPPHHPGVMGFGLACAAIESMTRHLAVELSPHGVRAICLLSNAIPEAAAKGSSSNEVFRPMAQQAGVTVEEMLAGAAQSTLIKRLPTLAQVANTAAFLASEHAGVITGTSVNLTGGVLLG